MLLPATIGRYEILRPIGEGAIGRVVIGRDTVLGRRVAIKTLRPELDASPAAKKALSARLRDEARATAALTHPNLVTIHDLGEDPGLGLYLVFELVSGLSLRERVGQGPLPPPDVARMARELGGALSFAHDAGLLHRDVKPDNVLLGPTGAKLSDLGLARLPEQAGAALPPSTTAYTAPEALRSDDFGPLADQFSLAATLYEALAGRRAFAGADSVTIATHIKNDDPAPLAHEANVDPRVDAVLRRALSKDPRARYATCLAFGEALATAIESVPQPARASEAPPKSMSIVPRKTRRLQNVIAGFALVVIVGLFFWGRSPATEGISLRSVAASFLGAVGNAPAPHVRRQPPPTRDAAASEASADDAGTEVTN